MDRSAIDPTDAFLTMVVYPCHPRADMRWCCIASYFEFIINIYYSTPARGNAGQPGSLHVLATILLFRIHIKFAILAMATQRSLSAQPAKAAK